MGDQSARTFAFFSNFKTRICPDVENALPRDVANVTPAMWADASRSCSFGPNCRFAHSTEDIRRPPFDRNGNLLYRPVRCNFYPDCKYGDRCQSTHSRNEWLYHPALYKNSTNRPGCRNGAECTIPRWKCPYIHPGEASPDLPKSAKDAAEELVKNRTEGYAPRPKATRSDGEWRHARSEPKAAEPKTDVAPAADAPRANGSGSAQNSVDAPAKQNPVKRQGTSGHKPKPAPSHRSESEPFGPEMWHDGAFDLRTYKTARCKGGESCGGDSCTYAHSDEELRRPPYTKEGHLAYRSDKCRFHPNCKSARACTFCHGDLEFDFHPNVYKDPIELCPDGNDCQTLPQWRCAYLHVGETPKQIPEVPFAWEVKAEGENSSHPKSNQPHAETKFAAKPAPQFAPKNPGNLHQSAGSQPVAEAEAEPAAAAARGGGPPLQLAPPFNLAFYKTVMCPYAKGEKEKVLCAAGDTCTFAHSSEELRRPPYDATGAIVYENRSCPYAANCRFGNSCKLAHGKIEFLYHPLNFKRRPCRLDTKCVLKPDWRCPYYHSNEAEGTASKAQSTRSKQAVHAPPPSQTRTQSFAPRPPPLYKTRICKYAKVDGDGEVVDVSGCPNGERCRFAHSLAEITKTV